MILQNQRKRRVSYAIIFIILLAIEVLIALFVHDIFIRPYVGDVLVVIVIYAGVRIVIPAGCKPLPIYIFLFAATVEVLQYFNLVQMLGLADSVFLRTLIGSVFDIKDIICYGIGCIILGIYEWKIKGKKLV